MDIYTPCFKSKSKDSDSVLPYTYLLKFKIDDITKYYYGLRYRNVRHNRSPNQDLWKKYFSSSKEVKKLLNEGNQPFEIIIHKTFKKIEEAIEYEIKFLTKLRADKRNDFLNKVCKFKGASTNIGKRFSEEHRKKISEAAKRRKGTYTLEQRKRMSETRKGVSYFPNGLPDIIKEKISKAHMGMKHTEETKKKLSEIGKNQKPLSEESRKKISMAHKGKKKSEETKKKMSLSKLGVKRKGGWTRKHSPETRQKMSNSHKGKKRPERNLH